MDRRNQGSLRPGRNLLVYRAMKLPAKPKRLADLGDFCRDTIAWMRANQIGNVAGGKLKRTANGTTIEVSPVPKIARGASAEICIFGELIPVPDSDPPEQAMRGGIIHCGPNNWFIADEAVDTSTDYDLLVWISVSCVVNTDDDGELLLPGIASGTEPVTWSSGASYPANTPPTVASPSATVILPIGRLVVADGVASFTPSGCGNFTVTHCAGEIGYSRT
jgi:hypothetical protein